MSNILFKRYSNNKPLSDVVLDFGNPLAKELVAFWLPNKNSGGKLVDLVGLNHGTLTNGAKYTESLKGQAIDLDGTDDYIDCGDPNPLKIGTGSFTIEAWFKVDSTSGTNTRRSIFYRGTGGGGVAQKLLSIDISGVGGDKITFQCWDGSNNPFIRDTASCIGVGWKHVVAVRDANATTLRLYIDGKLFGTTSDTSGTLDGGFTQVVSIGAAFDSLGNYVDGQIAHVRFWRRALTTSEAQQLYVEPYGMLLRRQTTLGYVNFTNDHQLYLVQLTADDLDTADLYQYDTMELDQPITTCSLYTVGHIPSSSGIPLSMTGMIPVSGTTPLYMYGYSSGNLSMSLYTMGASYLSQTMPLFMQVDNYHEILPFYISGPNPVSSSGHLTLFTTSNTSGTNYEYNHLSLYTNADPYHESMNLFVQGEDSYRSASGSMNLYTYGEGFRVENNINLYTQGATNDGVSGVVTGLDNNLSLYVTGDGFADGYYPSNTYMNLYLKGGVGASSGISLYTQGYGLTTSNMSMYTMGISGALNNAMSLYTRGIGIANSGLRLFTRGYIN